MIALNDEKYLNGREAFSIYMAVKHSIGGSYNVKKYGLYPPKFLNQFDDPSIARRAFEMASAKYQTEYRWVTALAGNLIIDPAIFVTDIQEEHYRRLRLYNSSIRYFEQQAQDLFGVSTLDELLKSGRILEMFIAGDVSPELFSSLSVLYDFDSLFKGTAQGYVWGLLAKRLHAYAGYVTVNADEKRLSSCLKSILTNL